tara:strand:+ start:303 stop:1064 length:762 start_codon:yes stop_codon:yes gene_type:complete
MPKDLLTGPQNITVYTPPLYLSRGFSQAMFDMIESWNGGYQFDSIWFEYYIRNEIELSGIQAEELTCFPQGWSVQEIELPWNSSLLGKVQGDDHGPTRQIVEIHDIYSTQEITEAQIFNELFSSTNEIGPAMVDVPQGASTPSRYLTFEQVIAARSRVFMQNRETVNAALNEDYARNLGVVIHDMTWGSGEPFACEKLFHVRAVRFFIDTSAEDEIDQDFVQSIPASIQPMAVQVADVPFLGYMTTLRRSLDV